MNYLLDASRHCQATKSFHQLITIPLSSSQWTYEFTHPHPQTFTIQYVDLETLERHSQSEVDEGLRWTYVRMSHRYLRFDRRRTRHQSSRWLEAVKKNNSLSLFLCLPLKGRIILIDEERKVEWKMMMKSAWTTAWLRERQQMIEPWFSFNLVDEMINLLDKLIRRTTTTTTTTTMARELFWDLLTRVD